MSETRNPLNGDSQFISDAGRGAAADPGSVPAPLRDGASSFDNNAVAAPSDDARAEMQRRIDLLEKQLADARANNAGVSGGGLSGGLSVVPPPVDPRANAPILVDADTFRDDELLSGDPWNRDADHAARFRQASPDARMAYLYDELAAIRRHLAVP